MQKNRGFTLIELMIVLAILGILAAIATYSFRAYQQKSLLSTGHANASAIRSAMITYACSNDHGGYPQEIKTWADLITLCRASGSNMDESALRSGFQEWIDYTPVDNDKNQEYEDFTLLLRLTSVPPTTVGAQLNISSDKIIKESY